MSREKSRYNTSEIDSATVGNTSSEIIAEDSQPQKTTYKYIRNLSETITIWIAVGIDAVVGKGIQLRPGEWSEWHCDNMTAGAVNGISESSDVNVSTFIGKL